MANLFASRRAAARTLAALGALVITSSLTGCSSNKNTSALAALRAENAELREAQHQLDAALNECDSRYDALTKERDDLRAQLDGASRAPRMTDDFGFAPGSGVTVSQRNGEIVVEVAGDVLFQSGKVDLRNDAKRTLDQIASVINSRYAGNTIRIAGHTDSDPIKKSGWKTNERLSSERALAVEEYLGSRGVNKDRMYAAAFGSSQPRSTKQESRRVEIVILASGAS
ncbi:MAG: OmpA family protein [Phycisphaerales bacterium]|nr:OmpA family protein [Phycisphaerales bacterium]